MSNNKSYNDLYNEISYLKIIINEISEYIKTKDNEEISFRLACLKKFK